MGPVAFYTCSVWVTTIKVAVGMLKGGKAPGEYLTKLELLKKGGSAIMINSAITNSNKLSSRKLFWNIKCIIHKHRKFEYIFEETRFLKLNRFSTVKITDLKRFPLKQFKVFDTPRFSFENLHIEI